MKGPACAAFLTVLTIPALLSAQQATVFYDHKPGAAAVDSRVSHRESGDKLTDKRAGLPVRLSALTGAKACIVVENANPVLYNYSAGARVQEVPLPQELEALLPAVQLALRAAVSRGFAAESPSIEKYALEIAQLYDQVNQVQSLRGGSDKLVSFDTAANRVKAAFEFARRANTNAELTYTALKKPLSSTSTQADTMALLAVEMLHLQQVALNAKAKAVSDEFENGRNALGDAMCVPVGQNRQKMFLSIKPKSAGDTLILARPRGDTVVAFEVDPISDAAFEVVAGAVLSFATAEKLAFELDNGIIRQSADKDPRLRPAMLALGRAWTASWIWGGFGVAGDTDGVTDLFLGPVGRFGLQGNGPQLNVGVGAVLSWIPTGLKAGAAVGAPLPSDAKDVDDVIDRSMRPSLGMMFTLTGLSFKD